MLFLSTATRFRIRAPVLPGLGRSQFAARGCPESLERRICELSLVHPHEKFTYFSSSLLIHLRAHAPVLRVLTIPRRSLILADRVRRPLVLTVALTVTSGGCHSARLPHGNQPDQSFTR